MMLGDLSETEALFLEALTTPPGPQKLYLDEKNLELCALVSPEDYQWAVQWVWRWKPDKHGRKFYAVRNTRIKGRQTTLFLHKEILKRMNAKKKRGQNIGDHINGDSLNCQRHNLRWATQSQNNANRPFARCAAGRFV